jgi:hypothetical protein
LAIAAGNRDRQAGNGQAEGRDANSLFAHCAHAGQCDTIPIGTQRGNNQIDRCRDAASLAKLVGSRQSPDRDYGRRSQRKHNPPPSRTSKLASTGCDLPLYLLKARSGEMNMPVSLRQPIRHRHRVSSPESRWTALGRPRHHHKAEPDLRPPLKKAYARINVTVVDLP